MNKPVIAYPCQWSYRIIGTHEADLRQAAAECIDVSDVKISMSNQSPGKTYVSMNVAVEVTSELMRDCFFMALKDHPAVKYIL